MGFLYSEKNDAKLNAEKRAEQNAALKSVYEVQKQEASNKNKERKNYINEQNALWKEEVHTFNRTAYNVLGVPNEFERGSYRSG